MFGCFKSKRTSPKLPASAAGTRNNECNNMNTSYESPPSAPKKRSRSRKPNRTSPTSAADFTSKEWKQEDEVTNEASYSFKQKMLMMRKIMKRKTSHKVKVGIFSRSAECEYEWLKTSLKSEWFQTTVKSVQPCCITNNGAQQFAEALSQCNFGILYHSQNRGRLNITNVTDSLYDEELHDLYLKLGKKNVIVVIDDLNEVSQEKKDTILENQWSLKEFAKEVFLFSKDERKQLE